MRCPLSPRQLEALGHAANGLNYKATACEMGISTSTVRVHLSTAYHRLGVAGRSEALLVAWKMGWIAAPSIPVPEGASPPLRRHLARYPDPVDSITARSRAIAWVTRNITLLHPPQGEWSITVLGGRVDSRSMIGAGS